MDLMTMILGGTGALAGAVAVRVIASDIGDNVPVLAKRLIIRAAKRLPGAENTRYQEEWLAHLNECRGSIPKLLHAIKCLTCARNLQRILAAPNSVSPVFEAGALFSIIDNTPEMGATIAKLRDLLNVDHLVYHSLPLGANPSAAPYIRLTYPASWIKRYLQMEYLDNDPVVREGLLRTPFRLERAENAERGGGVISGGCSRAWRWALWALHPGPEQARASGSLFNFVLTI